MDSLTDWNGRFNYTVCVHTTKGRRYGDVKYVCKELGAIIGFIHIDKCIIILSC